MTLTDPDDIPLWARNLWGGVVIYGKSVLNTSNDVDGNCRSIQSTTSLKVCPIPLSTASISTVSVAMMTMTTLASFATSRSVTPRR